MNRRLQGQKADLLNRGNYGVFPLEIVQRIVGEITASGENGGKAIMVWFYLLGHVNNIESSPRYGYAFPSVNKIAKDLKISRNAIKSHCDVLERFGLLETRVETKVSQDGKVTQTKLYKPLYSTVQPVQQQPHVPKQHNRPSVEQTQVTNELEQLNDEEAILLAEYEAKGWI